MTAFSRLAGVLLFSGAVLWSAPGISLSSTDGPPGSIIQVSGTGFSALAPVRLCFGSTCQTLAFTDLQGTFSKADVTVPATAQPGRQPVLAMNLNGTGASADFRVETDWPQFLGDAAHSGFNTHENMVGVKNAPALSLAWSLPANGGGSPVVVDDILYTGSAAAIDTRNGQLLWTFPNVANLHCSPAVSTGRVYIGGYDGSLYALDKNTGALLWTFATGAPIYSSPNVVKDVVYFGSYDGHVYAVHAGTGALVWKFKTGSTVQGSPAVVDGVVYAGAFDGTLYAIDAATGKKVFGFSSGPQALEGSPAAVNGIVYFTSTNGRLYAIDQRTGSFLWSFRTGDLLTSSVAVAAGVVYLPASDGYLYALDAQTGRKIWKTATAPLADGVMVANGVVYAGTDSYTGFVYAIEAKNGTLLWAYKTPAGIGSTPAVVDGAVYLLGDGLFKFSVH